MPPLVRLLPFLLLPLAAACAGAADGPTAPSLVTVASVRQDGPPPPAADPLPAIPQLGATRFLAFGDSITCGVSGAFPQADIAFDDANCQPNGSPQYPQILRTLLQNATPTQPITVDNEGRPGEEARFALSRFTGLVAARRPQGVLLLEGINDLNSGISVSATVASLQQMVEVGRVYGATVLVGTMFQTCYSVNPYTGRVRPNSTDLIAPFNSAVRAMAAGRQNVYVVNIDSAFGGGNCGDEQGINLLGEDGLHPSPSGYNRIAQTFGTAVRDIFAVRGAYQ